MPACAGELIASCPTALESPPAASPSSRGGTGGNWRAHISPVPPGSCSLCRGWCSPSPSACWAAPLCSSAPRPGLKVRQSCSSGAFLPRPFSPSSLLLSSLLPVLFPVEGNGSPALVPGGSRHRRAPSSCADGRDPLGSPQPQLGHHHSHSWDIITATAGTSSQPQLGHHQSHSWHPQPRPGCSWQHRSLGCSWASPGLPCQCLPGSDWALRRGFRARRQVRKGS